MRCGQCGTDNREARKFCRECGHALPGLCPACAFANDGGDKFCGGCGTALKPAPAAAAPAPASAPATASGAGEGQVSLAMPADLAARARHDAASLAGERRQVTALFTDMANFTATSEKLGEEGTYKLMGRLYEAMIDTVHSHAGSVQELTGDGIMALFGAPIAVEDAPLRACRAALAIQRRMAELEPVLAADFGVRPKLRIGINSGPVVVGELGDDMRMEFAALGDTLNLASRLESLAQPGTVAVSEETRRQVEGFVECSFLGEQKIKGKSRPERVHRLDAVLSGVDRFAAALHRGLTPLVGRDHEIATLRAAAEEAARGAVRVVNIAAAAGMGKSRLLHEFGQGLDGEKFFLLHGGCGAESQKTPLLPFTEIVRTSFRVRDGEGAAKAGDKLRRGLQLLGMNGEADAPFLQKLLGLPPSGDGLRGLDGEIVGARTREILRRALFERAALSPVIILVEDLQWIDSASEELLLDIIANGGTRALLIVTTYRPEYHPPWHDLNGVTNLALESLSAEETASLVRGRVGDDIFNDDIRQLITEKAEGNPLYAEEIARYVFDGRAPAGGDHAPSSAGGIVLPGSLRDIVMSRVDQLEDGPRAVLQAASVIGRQFPLELIQPVALVNGHLSEFAKTLENRDFILPGALGEVQEYRFSQAMVRDTVYDGLLGEQRTAMHLRAGEAIERLHGDHIGEWSDALAHHFGQSTHTESTLKYLALAGRKSLGVYALEEAAERFAEADKLARGAPDAISGGQLAGFLLAWVRLFYYRKDFRALRQVTEHYIPRIEKAGDRRTLSLLLFWQGFSEALNLESAAAESHLDRALDLARDLQDEECIGYACMGLLYLRYSHTDRQSRDSMAALAEEAEEIATRLGDIYLQSKILFAQSLHGLLMGRFEDSRRKAQDLVVLGRRAGDPRTISMGLYVGAYERAYSECCEEAIEDADEALRISPDPLDRIGARNTRGQAYAMLGRGREACAELADILREAEESGFGMIRLGSVFAYGAALAQSGEPTRGLRLIKENITAFERLDLSAMPAIGHMILGEIYTAIARGEEKASLGVLLRNP
ncbi:MAG: adenylate/guanylate cyclase domain-containing protein, partial [Alphaproteobacteria bacterium]|nr:adenylate/guanylate cyclase domain-containing protein [Alphaproteobacteria bacterium]